MAQIMSIANGGLYIDFDMTERGDYRIYGQHLTASGEYEYSFIISKDFAQQLALALHTTIGHIPSAWENQVEEIAQMGEMHWLKDNDIPYQFWSRHDS